MKILINALLAFTATFIAILLATLLFSSEPASALGANKPSRFNNHNNNQQHRPILRAPKINAKHNLTLEVSAGNVLGFDLYLPYPSSTFQCLQQKHYAFMIARMWHSYGAPDYSAGINLNNALVAGIEYRDVYFFPCPTKDPAAQLREAVRVTPTERWGTLWFDIEVNPSPGCGWSTTNFTANCDFFQKLIQEGQQLSLQMGLYSSHYEWVKVFGNASACPVAFDAGLPLWYANYDNVQTFADFTDFGGYSLSGGGSQGQGKVSIKQFNDKVADCNVIADSDFYPS